MEFFFCALWHHFGGKALECAFYPACAPIQKFRVKHEFDILYQKAKICDEVGAVASFAVNSVEPLAAKKGGYES